MFGLDTLIIATVGGVLIMAALQSEREAAPGNVFNPVAAVLIVLIPIMVTAAWFVTYA